MPVIRTGPRVVVSVTATESGDWQVVSTPTGFQGITSALFADNDYIHGFCRFENGEDWEEYDTDDDTTTSLLQITNVTGTVTIARPATPYNSSNNGERANAGSGTHTLTISLGAGTMKRIFREINGSWKTLTSGDATPSVADYRLFKTAGTTTITAFDDMEDGKLFIVRRGGADIVIADGAGISLSNDENITLTTAQPAAIFVEDAGVAHLVARVGSDILDEDDFASDSATKPPSQQSVAAYYASTANGRGASRVGVEDAASVLLATNVEGAVTELRRSVYEATGAGGTTVDIAKRLASDTNALVLYGGAPVDLSAYSIAVDTPSAGSTRFTFDFTLTSGVPIKIFA